MNSKNDFLKYWNQRRFGRRKNSNLSLLLPSRFLNTCATILLVLLVTFSCKSKQFPISSANSNCEFEGMVVDYSSLDGCGKLIVLNNGKILLPSEAPEELDQIHFGQKIILSFDEDDAMVSVCMNEDFIGPITCLVQVDTINFSWIDQYVSKSNQIGVYRCDDAIGSFIYLVSAKESILFSLKGEKLCSTPGKAMSPCAKRFSQSNKCRIWGLP